MPQRGTSPQTPTRHPACHPLVWPPRSPGRQISLPAMTRRPQPLSSGLPWASRLASRGRRGPYQGNIDESAALAERLAQFDIVDGVPPEVARRATQHVDAAMSDAELAERIRSLADDSDSSSSGSPGRSQGRRVRFAEAVEVQPPEFEPMADLAHATSRAFLLEHCPRTLDGFTAKLREIHGRQPSAQQPAQPQNTTPANPALPAFTRADIELFDARLIHTMPALVLAEKLSEVVRQGNFSLELYDLRSHDQSRAQLKALVLHALELRSLTQLKQEVSRALETNAWAHNDDIKDICVNLQGIAAVNIASDAGTEGRFRNTVAYQLAHLRCVEESWR